MMKDEIIALLNGLDASDPETAHCQADDAIIAFLVTAGFQDVADAYAAVADRAGGFWYA